MIVTIQVPQYSRKDYLNHVVDHHTYYSQFVNDAVMHLLKTGIGIESIQKSKDPHFNDIPLAKWDALCGVRFIGSAMVGRISFPTSQLIKAANGTGGISPSDCVCTLKAAAKMIRDEANAAVDPS